MTGPTSFCGTPECSSNNHKVQSVAARITKSRLGEITGFGGDRTKITGLFALRTADDEEHGRVRDRDGSSATSGNDKDGWNVTQM